MFFLVSAQNYWAKDLIFLVTSHEGIGMQAWVDQYLGIQSGMGGGGGGGVGGSWDTVRYGGGSWDTVRYSEFPWRSKVQFIAFTVKR